MIELIHETLHGTLSPIESLSGVLSAELSLTGTMSTGDLTIIGGTEYDGQYTATPNVEPIILNTKDKILRDDITVFKIPLWEVSNPFNGTTIVIGGEEVYGN